MPVDTPYESQIEADFRKMWRLLRTIGPPAGHQWTLGAGNPLRWYMGNIAASTRYGASIMIQRVEPDWHDEQQLYAMVRVSWDELRQVGRATLPQARRAIVWCEMGPRINFSSASLLGARACFLAAPGIDELFVHVRDTLLPAFSLYQDRLAESG